MKASLKALFLVIIFAATATIFVASPSFAATSPEAYGKDQANKTSSTNRVDRDTVCGDQFKGDSAKIRACKEAYDKQIIKRAEAAGKKLREDGKPVSDCPKIGFGGSTAGSRTQKACVSSWNAAKETKNEFQGNKCGGTTTFFDFGCAENANNTAGDKTNPIINILLTILGWLAGLVTLSVIGGIIYGGVLYTSAGDNAGQTKQGITFVVNSIVALITFIFIYALINFLVPGGLFN